MLENWPVLPPLPAASEFLDVRGMLSVQVHPSDWQTSYIPAGETGNGVLKLVGMGRNQRRHACDIPVAGQRRKRGRIRDARPAQPHPPRFEPENIVSGEFGKHGKAPVKQKGEKWCFPFRAGSGFIPAEEYDLLREDWPGLFYGGLLAFVIALAYGVVPLLLLLLGLGLLVKGGILLFLGMVLMVLGVLAGVFTLFFFPMALARYIGQRRLEAAFHPGLLWEGINEVLAEYVATYLVSVGLYILAGLVAAIPYVGRAEAGLWRGSISCCCRPGSSEKFCAKAA